jgi:hypothetical protein
MASRDSLEVRQLLKKGIIGTVITDLPIGVRIKYIGGGAVTSVTNTAATNLVLIATNSAGVSSTVTCTYAGASGSTIGAVVDTINASPLWEAKVMDCLRTMATASSALGVDTGALSTTTVDGESYYDIHLSTDVSKQFGYRLTYDRAVHSEKPKASHRVSLQEIRYYFAALAGVTSNSVQIWETNGTTETQIFRKLSVSAADTTINWASGEGKITANDGNDLVVIILDTTLADNAANVMTVVGELE